MARFTTSLVSRMRIGTGKGKRFDWAKRQAEPSTVNAPLARYGCVRCGFRFKSRERLRSCLQCGGPVEGLGTTEER